MKSSGYWAGWDAAKAGKLRECINPWSAQYLLEWYRGYDEAKEA